MNPLLRNWWRRFCDPFPKRQTPFPIQPQTRHLQMHYQMTQECYDLLCNPTPIIKYYFLTNWYSWQSVHKSPHSHGWGFIIWVCSTNIILWSQATVISALPIWRTSASGWFAKKLSKSKSTKRSEQVWDLHPLTKPTGFGTFPTDTKMRIALVAVVVVAGVLIGNNLISSVTEMTESRNEKLCQIDPSYCQWTPRSGIGPPTPNNASTQVSQPTSKHWKWLSFISVAALGQRSNYISTVTPRTVNRGVFCMENRAMLIYNEPNERAKYFCRKKFPSIEN